MANQTLAQMVRAKYPGAYTELNDQQLESAVRAKYPGVYDQIPSTPATQPAAPAGPAPTGDQPFGSLGIQTVSDQDWSKLTAQQKLQGVLKAAGYAVSSMAGMGSAGREAVDNPKTTLATAALSSAAPVVRAAIPNFARASGNFQKVASAVADRPVDVEAPGQVALRIQELADRGSSMPMVARKFLKRITDPEQGAVLYGEARDFYQNISRLSADEFNRLTPVMKREVGQLRAALHRSIIQTAESGGQGTAYQAAMKEYAQAAKLRAAGQVVKDAAVRKALPGGIAGAAAYYGYKGLRGLTGLGE